MPIWSKNFARAPLILLGVVEIAVLFASICLAKAIAYDGSLWADRALGLLDPRAAIMAVVMLLSLVAMGLYRFHRRAYFHEVLLRILAGLVAGSAFLAGLYYAIPNLGYEPKVAAIAVASALIALSFVRYYFQQHVDENVFQRRTIIYGAGNRSNAISKLRRRADRRGFKLIGVVAAPGDHVPEGKEDVKLDIECLEKFAVENAADEIVIAMDDRRGNLPVKQLLSCKLRGIEVIDVLEFFERETGTIRVDLVNPGWLIFSPGFRASNFRRVLKRLVDILLCSAVLVLATPIMALVFLAIKIFDGFGLPVFYRQRRVGLNGELFDVLKFRSMRPDAEQGGNAQWATEDDPRVTKIGQVLRRYRLDELPQIFNVLSGQMSLVGPRPERPQFVEKLEQEIPYYAERHSVKPGVTGWAQLKYPYGSSVHDAKEKLQFDLYYVKNNSLLLDLVILLQTVEVVLWGKGAR